MKLFRPSRKTLIIVTVVVLAVSAVGVTAVVYAAGPSGDGVRIVADVDRDGTVDEPRPCARLRPPGTARSAPAVVRTHPR